MAGYFTLAQQETQDLRDTLQFNKTQVAQLNKILNQFQHRHSRDQLRCFRKFKQSLITENLQIDIILMSRE